MANGEHDTNTFRDTVHEIYNGKVFFIDPKKFTGNTEEDQQSLIEQYVEQFPDKERPNLDDPNDIAVIKDLIDTSRSNAPFAIPTEDNNEEKTCIVNEPNENLATKEEIVSAMSGIDEDLLNPIPGTTEQYIEYIAAHEAEHCLQVPIAYTDSTLYTAAETLSAETSADFVANSHITNKYGEEGEEVVETMSHTRAASLLVYNSKDHATSIPLNDLEAENREIDYDASIQIAENVHDKMHTSISEHVGFSDKDESIDLYDENPELFWDIVDNAITQGIFNEDPRLKETIANISAAERTLKNLEESGNGYHDHDTDLEIQAAESLGRKPTEVTTEGVAQPSPPPSAPTMG